MKKKTLWLVISLMLMAAFIFTACQPAPAEVEPAEEVVVEEEPVLEGADEAAEETSEDSGEEVVEAEETVDNEETSEDVEETAEETDEETE